MARFDYNCIERSGEDNWKTTCPGGLDEDGTHQIINLRAS